MIDIALISTEGTVTFQKAKERDLLSRYREAVGGEIDIGIARQRTVEYAIGEWALRDAEPNLTATAFLGRPASGPIAVTGLSNSGSVVDLPEELKGLLYWEVSGVAPVDIHMSLHGDGTQAPVRAGCGAEPDWNAVIGLWDSWGLGDVLTASRLGTDASLVAWQTTDDDPIEWKPLA